MARATVDTAAARRLRERVGEADADHGSLARLALDADRPTDALTQAADNRQAHALAGDPVGLGPVARIENALQQVRCHADPGVGYDHAVGLDPDQIGRASCRESVCP